MAHKLLIAACVLFVGPAFAQTDSVSPAVRSEIAHVKDLINGNDRRYDQRFAAQEKATADALVALEKSTAAALAAAQMAVNKAEVANEKRLDSVNEFRGQLRDQASTFMQTKEAEAKLSAMNERLVALTARMDKSEAKGEGAGALWGYLVAALGVGLGIAGLVIAFKKSTGRPTI